MVTQPFDVYCVWAERVRAQPKEWRHDPAWLTGRGLESKQSLFLQHTLQPGMWPLARINTEPNASASKRKSVAMGTQDGCNGDVNKGSHVTGAGREDTLNQLDLSPSRTQKIPHKKHTMFGKTGNRWEEGITLDDDRVIFQRRAVFSSDIYSENKRISYS